jgi:hypothetical protein
MGNELQFEPMVYEKHGIIWGGEHKQTNKQTNKWIWWKIKQFMQHMLQRTEDGLLSQSEKCWRTKQQ